MNKCPILIIYITKGLFSGRDSFTTEVRYCCFFSVVIVVTNINFLSALFSTIKVLKWSRIALYADITFLYGYCNGNGRQSAREY